jgi:hypothetical protein
MIDRRRVDGHVLCWSAGIYTLSRSCSAIEHGGKTYSHALAGLSLFDWRGWVVHVLEK